MSRTKPEGFYPYDKDWGSGTSSMGGNFSPFPRINRYRDWLNAPENEFNICPRRAELVTEAYKLYEADPIELKMAKTVKYILDNYEINIREEELIVGEMAAPPKHAPLFPEFSFDWICDELKHWPLHERKIGAYRPTPQDTIDRVLALEDFWKGKTIKDKWRATSTEDAQKGVDNAVFFSSLFTTAGIGHCAPDYETILRIGLKGIRRKVLDAQAKLDKVKSTADQINKNNFYRAQLIALEGMENYILRYAALAAEMAEKETDCKRKKELEKISKICEWIAEEPPRTFYEALQLQQFIVLFITIESNGHSIGFGRFDQHMYRFYEHDIETGEATKAEIMELIEYYYLKSYTFGKLRNRIDVVYGSDGRGLGGETITLGGVDIHGRDATNDLTLMCLDAYQDTRMKTPWPLVRLHSKSPKELLVKTANAIRCGTGQPKIYNDDVAIEAMMAKGTTLQDARDYHVVGCVEMDICGKQYGWTNASMYNLAKVLELAINDGKWLKDDRQVGPKTGYLYEMKSFDEVLEAYETQLDYWTHSLFSAVETADICHQTYKPLPLFSCFMQGCIEKGQDVACGGTIYNYTGAEACGIGTVTDGLATIKQLIFDEKTVSARELYDAVKANWEGYQPLLQLVNSDKIHHYGNDDDYADDLAQFVFNTYVDMVSAQPNCRGGHFSPGVFSVAANVGHGVNEYASVDGRIAGEPISDGIGAVHTHVASHDVNGPMAMLRSMAKLDHAKATNGTLLNWMFDPGSLSGETGRDNFVALLREIIAAGVMHSQFNVIARETLEDAKVTPDDYRDLLVRVAGYSALFVALGPDLQQDIIERTVFSFD